MKVRIEMTGTNALMMSNQQAANPLKENVRELKRLGQKRNKTEDDLRTLSDMEFKVRLYHDDAKDPKLGIVGPYVPSLNIKRSIQDGAKRSKQGRVVVEALQPTCEGFPLLYNGPRDLESLIADENFRDSRLVRVDSRLVLRTRPIFRAWGLVAEFECDAEVLDVDSLKHFAEQAGLFRGLGDYRPEFGRYQVDAVEVIQEKEAKKAA